MPRWTNGRLDLGALGIVEGLDEISPPSRCWWEWGEVQSEGYYQTESAARRAAEAWARRAVKQASKRLEVGK